MNQFKFRLTVLLMNDSDTFYSRPNAQFWVLSKNNFVQKIDLVNVSRQTVNFQLISSRFGELIL